MTDKSSSVTRLLVDWRGGRQSAMDELMPIVYDELHRIAAGFMRRENSGHTLQATAVVNQAYLKLIDADIDWQDRAHFFAIAARTMRRLLVDHAKGRNRDKRGGGAAALTLNEDIMGDQGSGVDIIELDMALSKLAEIDERKSRIVELYFFGGLNYEETAAVLEVSAATVDRDLRFAKAWLHRELGTTLT